MRTAALDGETVGVRCESETIAAIGPDVAPEPGEETIDAAGAPLVPALVNGHTHAAMTLFRGYGGDLPLMRWLQEKVWPVEAKLDADDVYWGTRLACAEMIRNGTARFWDMYWQPEATARAVEDAGLRATIGGPLFDADGRTAEMKAQALHDLDALEEHGRAIGPSLAPHSIYTVSEELLRWAGEQAAERGIAIHIHLSETEGEVGDCLAEHGVRPASAPTAPAPLARAGHRRPRLRPGLRGERLGGRHHGRRRPRADARRRGRGHGRDRRPRRRARAAWESVELAAVGYRLAMSAC